MVTSYRILTQVGASLVTPSTRAAPSMMAWQSARSRAPDWPGVSPEVERAGGSLDRLADLDPSTNANMPWRAADIKPT